jgi:hypothetical protein
MEKIKNFCSKHKKGLIITGAVVLTGIVGTVIYVLKVNPFEKTTVMDAVSDAGEACEVAVETVANV